MLRYSHKWLMVCALLVPLPLLAQDDPLRAIKVGLREETAPAPTSGSDQSVKRLTPELLAIIDRHGRARGVDTLFIVAVIRQESGFNARATSSVGAAGLMQFMPATARRYGITNCYDPEQSVKGGTLYLRELLLRFGGNAAQALAAYNAGEATVEAVIHADKVSHL